MASTGTMNQASSGTAEDAGAATVSTESPVGDSHNPYCFPEFALPSGLNYKGVQLAKMPVKDDLVTYIEKVREFPMREDDVLLLAYPKCGTHWVGEILHMLTTGTTEYCSYTREHLSFEYCEGLPFLESLPSPRVLSTHLYSVLLPKEVVEKKVKIVHAVRNPRDAAVSLYYHLRQEATDKFTFDNFLRGYVQDRFTSWSHQFDFLRQLSDFEKAHPDHPIMHVRFEDLKRDPTAVIKDISKFVLGTPASDDFCEKVASAVLFSKMKEGVKDRTMPEHIRELEENPVIYRKGKVGDWKNLFTVAQNEMFDEFISRQRENDFGFTFKE